MNSNSNHIPTEKAELETYIGSILAQKAALEADNLELRTRNQYKKVKIEKLTFEIAVLRRARFGQSSERFTLPQLGLLCDDAEAPEGEDELPMEVAEHQALPAPSAPLPLKPVRRAFPDHLPREVIEHVPACRCPECEGTEFSAKCWITRRARSK